MRQYESFSEYTDEVCAQVRLKQARPEITAELTCHMEEQAQAYEDEGMPQKEAMQKAIEDMGDPVMTGGQLDATHRPKADKRLLVFAGLMIAVAVVMQALVFGTTDYYIYLAAGVVVCVALYYVDYTLISRYVWVPYTGIIIFLVAAIIDGYSNNTRISTLMLLLVPVYCAILYNMRGRGHMGIAVSIAAMTLQIVIVFITGAWLVAVTIGICCCIMLFCAAAHSWFGMSAKRELVPVIIFTIAAISILILMIVSDTLFMNRLQIAMFPGEAPHNVGYGYTTLNGALSGVQFIGESVKPKAGVPFFDFSLAYIAVHYGLFFVFLIISLMAAFSIYMFIVARRQKNSLAKILACGCFVIYVVQIVLCVLTNFGFMGFWFFVPFMYSGGSMAIANMAILGLFLSACKWNGIVSEKTLFAKRQRVKT